MRDQELIDGARAIASDMQLSSGRQARLARIIDRHLPWFEVARARGLGWDDVIEVLFVAGVKRENGQRLTRGHLSSLVWRKSKIAGTKSRTGPSHSPEQRARMRKGLPSAPPATVSSRGESADLTKRLPSYPGSMSFAEVLPDRPTEVVKKGDNPPSGASAESATLAYMRRSAALRQRPEEL